MPEDKTISKAKSVNQLAKACGRSHAAAKRWICREDWPFGLNPPWNVAQVKAWVKKTVPPNNNALMRDEMEQAKVASQPAVRESLSSKAEAQKVLIEERTRKLRQETDIQAGLFHSVEECEARNLRKVHVLRSGLLALPRGVASLLVGKNRGAIEQILTERIEAMLNEFAKGK